MSNLSIERQIENAICDKYTPKLWRTTTSADQKDVLREAVREAMKMLHGARK